MKTVTCDISIVTQLTWDTLYIDIDEDKNFEAKDFLQLVSAARKLGDGQRFYNIINVGAYTLPDHEARKLSSSREGSELKLADAFIIHSTSQKLIGNFYMRFHKPAVPTRFFTTKKEAEAWIYAIQYDMDMSLQYS